MKLSLDEVRDVSEEESEQLVRVAFDLERKIKARCATAHGAWWDLAEALYEFHELKGWKPLGYETLEEFLAQPDIGLSRRTFFRAVQAWRDLAVVKQLPPSELKEVEPSKALQVRPAIMAGEVEASDALDDAKELSYRDVVEKYREENRKRHGQAPDDSTPLTPETEPKYAACPTCGTYVPEDKIQTPATDGSLS